MDNIGYLLMKVSKDLRYDLTKELTLYRAYDITMGSYKKTTY